MRFIVKLERDSDNSDPGSAFVAADEHHVTIELSGPDRVIGLSRDDLVRILRATDPRAGMPYG